MALGKLYLYTHKNKSRSYIIINLKLIQDLSIKLETLKLLEKYISRSLQDLGIGKDFLNRTPVYRNESQEWTNGQHEIQRLWRSKGSTRQPIERKEIFVTFMSGQALVSTPARNGSSSISRTKRDCETQAPLNKSFLH